MYCMDTAAVWCTGDSLSQRCVSIGPLDGAAFIGAGFPIGGLKEQCCVPSIAGS